MSVGRDKNPPEDEIDYGTGEGAAYGGTDADAPLFIPHPNGEYPTKNNQKENGEAHSQYLADILKSVWGVARFLFSSSGAWNAIASVVIAVATTVYVVYAHRQWVAMSDQITQMRTANGLTQKALEGSDKAVQATIDNFQRDQRPWVVANVLQLILDQNGGSNMTVNTWITNTGKTPAFDVKISNFGSTTSYTPLNVDVFLKTTRSKAYSGVSNSGLMVNGYQANVPQITKPLTKQQSDDIRAHKLLVYTFGDITYTDSFRYPHFTRFCGIYDPTLPQVTGFTQFYTCKTHNFVDRNK